MKVALLELTFANYRNEYRAYVPNPRIEDSNKYSDTPFAQRLKGEIAKEVGTNDFYTLRPYFDFQITTIDMYGCVYMNRRLSLPKCEVFDNVHVIASCVYDDG